MKEKPSPPFPLFFFRPGRTRIRRMIINKKVVETFPSPPPRQPSSSRISLIQGNAVEPLLFLSFPSVAYHVLWLPGPSYSTTRTIPSSPRRRAQNLEICMGRKRIIPFFPFSLLPSSPADANAGKGQRKLMILQIFPPFPPPSALSANIRERQDRGKKDPLRLPLFLFIFLFFSP